MGYLFDVENYGVVDNTYTLTGDSVSMTGSNTASPTITIDNTGGTWTTSTPANQNGYWFVPPQYPEPARYSEQYLKTQLGIQAVAYDIPSTYLTNMAKLDLELDRYRVKL